MTSDESEEFVKSDKVCITKWMVLMLSTAFGAQPETTIKRWDKNKKRRVEIRYSEAVNTYNKKKWERSMYAIK